jgi:hypothetical protein
LGGLSGSGANHSYHQEKAKDSIHLDLNLRSQRVSDTSALLDAKPTEERCLYSTPMALKDGKIRGPEGQDPWERASVYLFETPQLEIEAALRQPKARQRNPPASFSDGSGGFP